jgi:hypothetical protein
MKKTIFSLTIFLSLVTLPTSVLAQGNQQIGQAQGSYGVQQGSQYSVRNDTDSDVSQGNQVQNQNQVVTQNQGEESQLQVATQQMEQLMDIEGLGDDVGQKIGAVAQKQVQAQSQIKNQLDKLKSRSVILKRLIGPNFGALKNLKQQIEQNQLRIRELQQLQTQVVNQADQAQLEEAVQVLLAQNTALEERIHAEEQAGSIFGWLIRLFN